MEPVGYLYTSDLIIDQFCNINQNKGDGMGEGSVDILQVRVYRGRGGVVGVTKPSSITQKKNYELLNKVLKLKKTKS